MGRGAIMGRIPLASAAICCLALSSCANSGPQSIGRDMFMVSARVPLTGQTGAKTEALETAQKHCASQGKQMSVENITSSECALHGGCGEAEIIYMCLPANSQLRQPSSMTEQSGS